MLAIEAFSSILPAKQAAELQRTTSDDRLIIPIDRPESLGCNQLGLLALDLRELHPLHALIIERGQIVEAERANAGFNPNTVEYVWSPQGLSLDGVAVVVRNYHLW